MKNFGFLYRPGPFLLLAALIFFLSTRWFELARGTLTNVAMLQINHVQLWRTTSADPVESGQLTFVTRAIEFEPSSTALRAASGLVRLAHHQEDEALATWRAAGLEPAQVSVSLGHYAVVVAQPDVALFWFQYATELEPTRADAWHEMGAIFEQRGNLKEARVSYEQAHNLGFAPSADPLARLLRNEGMIQQAATIWTQALGEYPDHEERLRWWHGLVNGYRASEQWSVGLETAEKARKEFPDDARLHVEYGAILYGIGGDPEAALFALSRATELDPNMVAAYSTSAGILAAEKRYLEAYDWYALAERIEPQNANWPVARGNMARAAGNLSLALQVFEETINRFPDSGPAYYGAALVYLERDESEKAVRAITRAVRLTDEHNVQYLLRAGAIYEWAGYIAAANEAYRRVVEIDPDNREAAGHLKRLNSSGTNN